MRRTWLIVSILAIAFIFADAAQANFIGLVDPGSRYFNGGPFTSQVIEIVPDGLVGSPIPGWTNGLSFTTFCLERTETVTFYALYPTAIYVYTIDPYAELGGGGAVLGKDDLDPMSAYLYYQFRTGGSIGAAGLADTALELQALQAAFWAIEGEQALPGAPISGSAEELAWVYYNAALSATAPGGIWTQTWGSTIGPVVVLNLFLDINGNGVFDNGDYRSQSQLALRNSVPEPATMLLLGLALVGLAGIGRKFKR